MATASNTIPDILASLHVEPLNSGACYGDWIANPSGGELASTGYTIAFTDERQSALVFVESVDSDP